MQKQQVYKCEKCGNIVSVNHVGGGTLTCCDQAMTALAENSTDAAQEKHVPVITKIGEGFNVTVGSVNHPMGENHYIEWIELSANGKSYFQYLKPGDKPEAVFNISAAKVTARAYCNLHGLWKAEL